MQELASILYQTYVEATSGESSRPLPDWVNAGPAVRDAWRAVAGAAERALIPQR